MKLRLYPPFYKAVLTCLAFAAAHALPFTVATGSTLAAYMLTTQAVAEEPDTLYWAVDADGEWSEEGDDADWAGGDGEVGAWGFTEGKGVYFGSGAQNKEVTVVGEVRVSAMTVDSRYTFRGGKICVAGELTANSGSTVSFAQEVEAGSLVLGQSSFVANAAAVHLHQNAQVGTLDNYGKLTLDDDAVLTISNIASASAMGTVSGGTVLLKYDGTGSKTWRNTITGNLTYDSSHTFTLMAVYNGSALTVQGGGTLALNGGSVDSLTMRDSALSLLSSLTVKQLDVTGTSRITNGSSGPTQTVYLFLDLEERAYGVLSPETFGLGGALGENVGLGFTGGGAYTFAESCIIDTELNIASGTTVELSGAGNTFTFNRESLAGVGVLQVNEGVTATLAHFNGEFGLSATNLGTFLLHGGTLQVGAGAYAAGMLTLAADSVMAFDDTDATFSGGEDFLLNGHTLSLSGEGSLKFKAMYAYADGGSIRYSDPEKDTAKLIVGEGFSGSGIIYANYSTNYDIAVDIVCAFSGARQTFSGDITGYRSVELSRPSNGTTDRAVRFSGDTIEIGRMTLDFGILEINGDGKPEAIVQHFTATAGELSITGRTLHVTDSMSGVLSKLTLKSGGTLKVGYGEGTPLALNALSVSGKVTLSLTGLDAATALFGLGSNFTLTKYNDSVLALDLDDWEGLDELDKETSHSFALFSGAGLSKLSPLEVRNWSSRNAYGTWSAVYDKSNGKLDISYAKAVTFFWNDDNDSTWEEDSQWAEADGGNERKPFIEGPNSGIIFGTQPKHKDVTLEGKLSVGYVAVQDDYTFTTDATTNASLEVNGGLHIEYEKSARFVGDGEVSIAAVTGDGTLVVDVVGGEGVSVSLDNQATAKFKGNVTLNCGTLAVNGLTLHGKRDDTGILTLAGGALDVQSGDISSKELRVAGAVSITGDNTQAALAAATITGEGTLSNTAGHANSLTGDVGAFIGTIEAAADASWTLRGDLQGKVAALGMGLAGEGTITLAYENAAEGGLTLTGRVTGGLSLENKLAGGATLVLANAGEAMPAAEAPTTGGKLIFHDNTIQLGTATQAGAWAGTQLQGQGEFILVNGRLENSLTDADSVSVKVDARGAVDAGGTASSMLSDIVIHGDEGGSLSNVSGGITAGGKNGIRVKLVFGESNIGNQAGEIGDYLIRNSGNLVVDEIGEAGLTVDFTNEALLDILEKHRQEDYKTWVHLLYGGELQADVDGLLSSGYGALLSSLGFNFVAAEGGDLVIAGTSKNVYLALNEWEGEDDAKSRAHAVDSFGILSGFKATVVDAATQLTITVGTLPTESADAHVQTDIANGGLTVNNLVGLKGAVLHGKKAAGVAGAVTIVLNNAAVTEDIDTPGLDHAEGLQGAGAVRGQDTLFEGTIRGDAGVNFVKIGAGTLTVGDGSGKGGLDLLGSLTLANGGLTLQGNDTSRVDEVIFDYATGATKTGLAVAQNAALSARSISEAHGSGGEVRLTNGGALTLTGASELHATSFSGDASGRLVVAKGGSLTLAESKAGVTGSVSVSIQQGGTLSVENGARVSTAGNIEVEGLLDLGASKGNTLGGLSGSGVLAGGEGCELAITGAGTFSGTLTGSATDSASGLATGGGALTVAGELKLVGAGSTDYVWHAAVQRGGSLAVDVQQNAADLHLDITLQGGSHLGYILSTDNAARLRGDLAVKGEAGFSVVLDGSFTPSGDIPLGLVLTDGKLGSLSFTLDGAIGRALEGELRQYEDGSLYIGRVRKVEANIFNRRAMAKNAAAGAALLWESAEHAWAGEGDLRKFWGAAAMNDGAPGSFDRPLAALAGASISTLGSALSHDMQRQLSAIRTRTMSMGDDLQSDSEPAYHMWVNGESSYHKLSADALAPGYRLSGWGGTVGMDYADSDELTIGIALSAMYGDLKVQAADAATGDLDTTYVSAFARVTTGDWMHAFVLSGGLADASLTRTVNYGSGSFTTRGKTSGYAVGALYEVGYLSYLAPDSSFILQPVFNIELRHAMLKGYSESGSDAGLRVGDITHTALTFGLGARVQALLGLESLNGGMLLESRALLKADTLDRRGKADNRLINGAATSREVESARVGAVGIELGAGISLPVDSGSIFLDAAVELRSGYSHVDANVGYRMSF